MYNLQKLQDAFQNLVGVRQPYTAGVPQISQELELSTSGIYVDDKNPLASTENMYWSSPNFQPSTFPVWVSGRSYVYQDVVNVAGVLYKSKGAISNSIINPSVDTNHWGRYDPFGNWITNKKTQAVSNMMAEVVKIKKLQHIGKAIIERMTLYRGAGSVSNRIMNTGQFVGFSILPQQAEALWVILDQIGIQLTEAQTLRFYLYHSDVDAPLNTWDVKVELAKTFSWTTLTRPMSSTWAKHSDYLVGVTVLYNSIYYRTLDDIVDSILPPDEDARFSRRPNTELPELNCILKYLSQNTNGFYIFGYYQDDLIGQAIQKTWNAAVSPCPGCDGTDLKNYNSWSQYTTFTNICFPATALNEDRNLPDMNKVSYTAYTNWGMNFSITVRCDLTDFVIYNLQQYADVYAMQICKEFLMSIKDGVRIGPNPAQTKLSAIAELDPKAPGNWIQDYNKSIEALNLDISGFSTACMSCNEKGKKINYFTI